MATKRIKSRRRSCKHGKLKRPVRTKKGGKVPIEELTGRKKFYKVKDQDEADKMLAELEKFNISDVQKKKGGSVIERNPYNYPPRSI